MRRFQLLVLLMIWAVQSLLSAAEFKLTNGDIIRGEPASVDAEGMVIRQEIGGFSDRISWARLTQESLKSLLENPQAKRFVEPFIEVPIEVKKEKEKKKEIVIREPPRPERPVQKSFFAGLLTPAGFMVLAIIFFANIYSAFHIAKFRGRPVALVVGTSVILPVIGPILFLSMPSTDAAAPPPTEAAPVNTDVVSAEAKVAGMQSNLGLAAHQKGGPKQDSSAQVYKRTEVTMDRRFFETKFAGYFRMVPENPDMVLVVKTPKQEYVARRISRISSNEVHLQLLRGNTEAGVPFGEISEVQVRHKDAK
ncbi:MAG TPA: hypothetical protein VI282_19260 [Verrucomicrobiae bacterium]|jgi:hypothetical protein